MSQYLHFRGYLGDLDAIPVVRMRRTTNSHDNRALVVGLYYSHQIPVFTSPKIRRAPLQRHLDRIQIRLRLHLQRVDRQVVQGDVLLGAVENADHVHHRIPLIGVREADRLLSTVQGCVALERRGPRRARLRPVRRRTAVLRLCRVSPA